MQIHYKHSNKPKLIIRFSELLSTLSSIFFPRLQDLQRVTNETEEDEVSSSLQSPQLP